MTRHLLRLIWNRKRQNFLLTLEIFFSFLTLFGVTLFAVQYANNARQPLGYSIDRLWRIGIDPKESDEGVAVKARHRETIRQLMIALQEMPEIEGVAASVNSPYGNSSWGGGIRLPGGRRIDYGMNHVTDDYRALLGIRVVAGRWFSREDDAATWRPVVITQRLATEIFGDGVAVGQIIPDERDPNGPPADPGDKPEVKRVVGVIDEFRQHGELATPEPYLFYRIRLAPSNPKETVPHAAHDSRQARHDGGVRGSAGEAGPGSGARLVVRSADARHHARDKLRQYASPLMVVGTIAVFLLLMVALGLTGVVWQSVTQRIREFGLRRAKGATIPNVRTQVLVEMVIMTSSRSWPGSCSWRSCRCCRCPPT